MKSPTSYHILVATNHLNTIGGTEIYTYYLLKSLKKIPGLSIAYFTFDRGLTSDKIENDLGIPFKSRNNYDLIIANHNSTVNYLFGQGPIVQICHGTLPPLEQPSPLAIRHVAISEETASHLRTKGFDAKVVLNGIDTETFKPIKPIRDQPKTLLSLCQNELANHLLRNVCESENLTFHSINKFKNPKFHISREINEADLVVGLGRSVYDAMACGRPCIIYDQRSYNGNLGDGYLNPDEFDRYVRYNCSGRYRKNSYTEETLIQEVRKYDPGDGEKLRKTALEKLNMDLNSKEILEFGLQIPNWSKTVHALKTVTAYNKYKPIFKQQKRFFRIKMQKAYQAGKSKKELLDLIHSEKFPFHIRLSLYLHILKMR